MRPKQDGVTVQDDGFRFDAETIDRGILAVELQCEAKSGLTWRPAAAAAAVLVSLGLGLAIWPEEEPCVTWTCQLETLSIDEMQVMLDVLDEEVGGDEYAWLENNWDL